MAFRQLTPQDLQSYLQKCEHEGIRATIRDLLSEGMDMFGGSFLIHDGDLHIEEDFDTGDMRPYAKTLMGRAKSDWEGTVVIIHGSLSVSGYYNDTCNDAPVCVFIDGDLSAKNINTAGFLEVTGNVTSKEAIIGDYNDGGALIHGDLKALVFLPMDHAFDIRGEIDAVDHIERSLTGLYSKTEPTHLHPNYYAKTERGYEILEGEYEDFDITNGESVVK